MKTSEIIKKIGKLLFFLNLIREVLKMISGSLSDDDPPTPDL